MLADLCLSFSRFSSGYEDSETLMVRMCFMTVVGIPGGGRAFFLFSCGLYDCIFRFEAILILPFSPFSPNET